MSSSVLLHVAPLGFDLSLSVDGALKFSCFQCCTWCGRKVMRLATLCTNRQRCCLPLHKTVRLTPAVDSVQVWTCYSCYAIVESVWSEVMCVRCVTKMDRQMFVQRCAIKFCVKLGESATVTYEKLQRAMENIPYPRHKCSDGTSSFQKAENKWKTNLVRENGWQCGKSEVSGEVRSSIDVENDQ